MEDEKKIVKVYSNNSKKARLKRNKNKFQRIWDAKKQTYVKVRKAKYPVRIKVAKPDWREVDNSKALKRRSKTSKKSKSVPVNVTQKPEIKKNVRKEPARVHAKIETINSVRLNGVNHVWDPSELKYKRVA